MPSEMTRRDVQADLSGLLAADDDNVARAHAAADGHRARVLLLLLPPAFTVSSGTAAPQAQFIGGRVRGRHAPVPHDEQHEARERRLETAPQRSFQRAQTLCTLCTLCALCTRVSQSGRRAEQQHGQEQDRRPQEEQHGARHVGQPARRVVGQRRERVDEVGRVVEPRVLFHVLRWGAGAAARRAAGGHGSWTTAAGSPFLYLAVPRGWARAPIIYITVPVQQYYSKYRYS